MNPLVHWLPPFGGWRVLDSEEYQGPDNKGHGRHDLHSIPSGETQVKSSDSSGLEEGRPPGFHSGERSYSGLLC